MEDLLVIIRSVGERTEGMCRRLVLDQGVLDEKVLTVREVPFSAALRKALQLGVLHGHKWTLCIDADVLVSEEGFKNLLGQTASLGDNVFEVQGLVLDKFFQIYRPAGNHLYRTKYLEKALEFIPAEGSSLRPESDMLKGMSRAGFVHVQCDAIVGLHDYDQYFVDIYRKCFLQAHKHHRVLPLVEKYWIMNAQSDVDFRVALWASLAGRLYNKVVYVDKRFLQEEAHRFLEFMKLKEKSILGKDSNDSAYVQDQLKTHAENCDEILQSSIFDKSQWNTISNVKKTDKSERGFFEKILHRVGDYVIAAGKRVKSLA